MGRQKKQPLFDNIIGLIPGYDPVATAGDCWWDEAAAQKAIDFYHECLQFIEGDKAGQPFILEPWQQAIVANIYGWKQPNGKRRYREVFVFIPRKNGKTPWSAGLVLYELFCGGEAGAQIYSAAAEKEQATLVFRHAAGMAFREPELSSRVNTYRTYKSMEHRDNNGVYKALTADAKTKHGFNAQLVIIDELHAHPNSDLMDVLITSTASRSQPLIVHTTTSDYEREGSPCNEKHNYATKVRDGIIVDPAFLPVIYEASKDEDWTNEDVWHRCNPNLGISVSLEYLQRECRRAIESPTHENLFKRLHLNIRTEQDVRWLAMDKWDACSGAVGSLGTRRGYGGLDLSSTTDLTSFVLVFPPVGDDPLWRVLPFFWVPGDNAHKRERQDKVPYETWAREGYIKTTPGNVLDYDFVRAEINELHKQYNFKQIGLDRWAATQITTQLEGDGFEIIPVGQGFASMSAPTKELEKIVLGKKLAHGGHPVLRWCASNVTVDMDAAGNLKPNKGKSTERIDGISATIDALAVALSETTGPSVYEERGLITV